MQDSFLSENGPISDNEPFKKLNYEMSNNFQVAGPDLHVAHERTVGQALSLLRSFSVGECTIKQSTYLDR